MLRTLLLTAFFFGLVNFNAGAQAQKQADSLGAFTIPRIDTWKIHSTTIGEDYTLYVLRTEAYDTTKISLPVLYMTDGDWNMTVAMNCFSMLRQDYSTREPLIVGIGYGKNKNQRFRDLDPATGGPAFLTFIEKEVMPFINNAYRTTNERSIYGYSMGGMFTTYILFNRPELFNQVFIGAPGNNGRLLMPAARDYFKDHSDLKAKVFIGVGSYEHETQKNIDSFTTYLSAKKLPDLQLRYDFTPNANHGAALAAVMQNAIAFGYCEKHTRIKVSAQELESYKGTYDFTDTTQQPSGRIFTKGGKLFITWNVPNDIPQELIPFARDKFFIEERQSELWEFRKEKGKSKMVVTEDKVEYIFTKR